MHFARPCAGTARIGLGIALAILGTLTFATLAGATVLRQHYDFAEPVLERTGQGVQVTLEGAWSFGRPGEPVLPMIGARLLLPPGEELVRISVLPGERHELGSGIEIAPGQPQAHLSSGEPPARVEGDPAIYGSSLPFPGRWNDEPHAALYRGYRILTVVLHPFEYIPAEGRLSVVRSFDVEVETAPSLAAYRETEAMLRKDASTRETLAGRVDNPGDASAYDLVQPAGGSRALDPSLGITYLIVTTESWAAGCAPLVAFESARGHKAAIFLMSWIVANYTGVDDQAKIREFVKDAYQTWGSDYLLLVGDARDANGIPHRGLYSSTDYGDSDSDIPADLYYGGLDGNWNTDGDGYWGEPAEADMIPEVAVGRACVDEAAEMSAFVTKTTRYANAPVVAESGEAMMAGELLWSNPLTYGDTYKEEVRLGSSANGYTTVGFPGSMNVTWLYDHEGTWSGAQLIQRMESGMNIVNHLGHANVDYAMKLYNTDIPSFDNDGVTHSYNFVYSQGCYCGSFDNRGDGGGYGSDCFAEEFQTDDHGAAAVVMNSRYGWGDPGGTNGSSQFFDREFFDAMFSERIYAIGPVNDDSRVDVLWAIDYGANRWCYYELNLFGDPAMHLWTAAPRTASVSYPQAFVIGNPDYPVAVTQLGGLPIAGAQVTVYDESFGVYDTGVTNLAGQVVLHPQPVVPCTLRLTVAAHDFLPFEGTTQVIPPSGPYLVLDHVVIEDALTGDADGYLDAGEDATLKLALKNVGTQPATHVTGSAASADPLVVITSNELDFGDIAPGEVVVSPSGQGVRVAGHAPDGYVIAWTASAHADQGDWDSAFSTLVHAPALLSGPVGIDDSAPYGNGDGGIDPDETVFFTAEVANAGHADACNLTGTLTCSDPNVVVTDGEGVCLRVTASGEGVIGGFGLRVLPGCPSPSALALQLAISCPMGYETDLEYEVFVGAWVDDAEADRGWALAAPDDDASSGRWTRADPVGTVYNGSPCQPEDDHTSTPGTICFVTGNGSVGGAAGEADVDGGKTTLLSPVFDLGDATSASIEYWRWYTNDLGNSPDLDTWDVDVTADGANWVHLEHTTESANSWTHYAFDLAAYVALTDQVRVRFVAGDVAPGSLVEAAVDDFQLTANRRPVTGAEDGATILRTSIEDCRPNPFNPRTAIRFAIARAMAARLEVVDVSGRVVRRLVDGPVAAGSHTIYFDGRDGAGRPLPSGVYFVRLDTPDALSVRTVTLLK
ncbi:MAG: C25 family cysteine peptidase [Candidatus Eisenbacteria bacterium]